MTVHARSSWHRGTRNFAIASTALGALAGPAPAQWAPSQEPCAAATAPPPALLWLGGEGAAGRSVIGVRNAPELARAAVVQIWADYPLDDGFQLDLESTPSMSLQATRSFVSATVIDQDGNMHFCWGVRVQCEVVDIAGPNKDARSSADLLRILGVTEHLGDSWSAACNAAFLAQAMGLVDGPVAPPDDSPMAGWFVPSGGWNAYGACVAACIANSLRALFDELLQCLSAIRSFGPAVTASCAALCQYMPPCVVATCLVLPEAATSACVVAYLAAHLAVGPSCAVICW